MTEQLTPELIKELAGTPGPCISIVLTGDQAGGTATELKGAISAIRKELKNRNVDAEPLLAAIAEAGRDNRGETKSRGAIAIFGSPSTLRIFRTRASVKSIARAGDQFDLRTILAIANDHRRFYILALSQNRTRILKCTQASSEEIPFPAGFAASLADAMQTDKPDHVLDNRKTGGPSVGSMAGVTFGTTTDREDKDQYLLHFFAELDRAVNTALKGCGDPLIAAGVDRDLALYRRVNTYPSLVEPGVQGAPDGLEGGEMHRRAIELLDERARRAGGDLLRDFDKRVGTGHASTHIQEIVAAAWEGRVSNFLFQENAQYAGTFDAVRRRIRHADQSPDSQRDLIEWAAYQTILRGGEAHLLPASAMPKGVPVCAIFRYPAPQNAMNAQAEANA